MPSDKHNSVMVKATGLIFSLFDVASSQDVPFGTPQDVTLHSSWIYQCPPFSPVVEAYYPEKMVLKQISYH